MKMPWRKNFNKLPEKISNKLNEIKEESIKVSVSKEIKKEDIIEGKYKHIGIMYNEENELIYNNLFLPNPKVGRYSNYNVNGRTFLRKDLPKIDKAYSREMPIYGDWSRGSFTQTINRKVWQREFWLPKELFIEINVINQSDNGVVFKFSIDRPLTKTEEESFYNELLYFCNVLQENTGICDVFKATADDMEYINTINLDWQLLPPGTENREENVKYLLGKHRNPTEKLMDVYSNRIEFFDSLNPQQYITGSDKFNRYFGAWIKDDLVILENSNYGNAIYIFFEDWKELSKLSRVDLLNSTDKNFERIPHSGNWENRVKNIILNHQLHLG